MSEASTSAPARNYSAFDVELTDQALNVRMFIRLLGWMRPYRLTLLGSVALVIVAAGTAVLMPVIVGRVVIDTVLLPNPSASALPDYGLVAATQWLADLFGVQALTAAGMVYIALVLGQSGSVFWYGDQILHFTRIVSHVDE